MSEFQLVQAAHALPKIDLHRHLEGSLRLETLIEVAKEYGLDIPSYNPDQLRPFIQIMPEDPHSWQIFLSKFNVLRQFYRSPDVIRRVTREAVEDAADDNVKYLELRFTPQALNNLLNNSFHDVVGWVCSAAAGAARTTGIQVSLIVSVNRHESLEIAEQAIQAALDFRDAGVRGIDLAGQEAFYSAKPFRSLFEQAKSAGLGLTVHAGEWDGAASILDALDYLHADRIGHGTRALEDPNVLEKLITRETVLEVCPTSNVQSGVVDSLAHHPLVQLAERGVMTTINTDDPRVSNICLSDEVVHLITQTGLTFDDIKKQILTAARAAFLPSAERDALVVQFNTWLQQDTPF